MRLVDVGFEGFRNLVDARVELSPSTTVLLGDNGQGKTSLLEAVGVLATTRSFRRARSPEMARHGQRTWRVRGTVEAPSGLTQLEVLHAEGRRVTRVADVEVDLVGFLGHLSVVAITQAHSGVIRGTPQERRDFLDRGLLGLRPAYLHALSRYKRTLKHKNALLRAGADGRGAELAAWNERLAEDGAAIVVARREYVRDVVERLAALAPRFLLPDEPLELRMIDLLSGKEGEPAGDVPDVATARDALLRRMDALQAREVGLGQSLVGPHRDELDVALAGRDIRKFASSGQQRGALLALKLAKVDLFRARRGETPVLLVDDVDTEIDRGRLTRFLEHVGGNAQALLTSSKRDLFGTPPPGALFLRVERGLLTALPDAC